MDPDREKTATERPQEASSPAVAAPAGPPPTMAASNTVPVGVWIDPAGLVVGEGQTYASRPELTIRLLFDEVAGRQMQGTQL